MNYPVTLLNSQNIVNAAPSTNDKKQHHRSSNKKLMGRINSFESKPKQKSKNFSVERRSGDDRRHINHIKSSKLDSRNRIDRRSPSVSIEI